MMFSNKYISSMTQLFLRSFRAYDSKWKGSLVAGAIDATYAIGMSNIEEYKQRAKTEFHSGRDSIRECGTLIIYYQQKVAGQRIDNHLRYLPFCHSRLINMWNRVSTFDIRNECSRHLQGKHTLALMSLQQGWKKKSSKCREIFHRLATATVARL